MNRDTLQELRRLASLRNHELSLQIWSETNFDFPELREQQELGRRIRGRD